VTTDRPRPRGRSVRRWDPGRRPDLEKTNSPAPRGAGRLLLAAGACACACARPRPSLVFLAPAPPSPSVQRLSGCHWQAQAAGVLAASGWAGLGLRAHIASSQSPVPCSSYRGFAVGLCLRQRTATQRVSRPRPSLSGCREREGEAPYSAHGSRRTPIGRGRAIIIGARTFSAPSLKSL
jgi:hypothetical protein